MHIRCSAERDAALIGVTVVDDTDVKIRQKTVGVVTEMKIYLKINQAGRNMLNWGDQ
jgi:hypothetical protein